MFTGKVKSLVNKPINLFIITLNHHYVISYAAIVQIIFICICHIIFDLRQLLLA